MNVIEHYENMNYCPNCKKLKALEIIKNLPQEEKEMLINAVYTYTKNEEEYELLKEVLLWNGN